MIDPIGMKLVKRSKGGKSISVRLGGVVQHVSGLKVASRLIRDILIIDTTVVDDLNLDSNLDSPWNDREY